MKEEETFNSYDDFTKRREELEGKKGFFVDSYCDKRLGVFKLISFTVLSKTDEALTDE